MKKAEAAQVDRTAALERSLDAALEQLRSLERELLAQRAARLDAESARQATEAELAAARAEVGDLRGSWSWKLTGPMRRAVKAVRGY